MELVCNLCKKSLMNNAGGVKFPCPQCLKYEIVRCVQCRKNAAKYTCPQCGFEGPN